MANLIARDSTRASDIPHDNLAVVLGYGDGIFMWSSADWALFPNTIVPLSIVVFADDIGDILDVERGDASPSDVPGWVRRFNRPHRRKPTIYANRSTWPEVVSALQSAGIEVGAVDWAAATLDGTADVPGAALVQYKGQDMTHGHYDEWLILDPGWVGAAPPVPPQPVPTPIPTPTTQPGFSYTIQAGDTLSGIAARCGVSWVQLWYYADNRNVIRNPDLIFAGQVIRTMCDAAAHAPAPSHVCGYTVKSGDTLSGIAAAHGMNWPDLWNFAGNRQSIPNPNLIYVGQTIAVPC